MTTIAGGLGIYADDANVSNARVSVTTLINEHGHGIATVDRAEFLRAVETELNVIVLDRADLPEIKLLAGDDRPSVDVGPYMTVYAERTDTPERLRNLALTHLAMAEHLEAHPPLDQADVDTLAALLKDDAQFGLGRPDADDIARRLVQAGVRPPKAD